tara:strand:- start:14 stop:382 length:369 start_codon:yes stop_codon:yes gene_type:complete
MDIDTTPTLKTYIMAKGLKTGGRQLGTPNKRTAIGHRVAEFVDREMDELPDYVRTMSRKDRAEFFVKLLPYCTPKFASKTLEIDIMEDTPIFTDVQIVTTTEEKERLEKVRAYEEKHGVEIL